MSTEKKARDLLGEFNDAIAAICKGAWDDWMHADLKHWRCNRTRAGFVWEQMIERAHQAFVGNERFYIHRLNESYLFVLDGAVAFRFKKSDQDGRTSNVPTQASLAFHDPEQTLPGIPEVSRVEVGYVLNDLQSAIADIRVVGRANGQERWSFSLMPRADIVTLRSAESPSEPRRTPLVAPKTDVKRENENQERE